jgi:hypothetical protein
MEPPRDVAGNIHSHRPIAPGIAYQPEPIRRPFAPTPGSAALIEGASWDFSDARSAPPALVLGYGSIDEATIRSGLALLGSVYDATG